MTDTRFGYYYNNRFYGVWLACRERTTKWGCPNLIKRIERNFGMIDVFFGKTDGILKGKISVDIDPERNPTHCCDWKDMPQFKDNQFGFGFWDPPYDKMYMPQFREIWRVCKRLSILHTKYYVKPKNAVLTDLVAVIYGPNQSTRLLQIIQKRNISVDKWIK